MSKKSMIIFGNWADMICSLPDEMAGKLSKAIFKYGFDGEDPEDPVINAMLISMKGFIDENAGKYEKKKERAAKAREQKRLNSSSNINTNINSNINTNINSNIKSVNDNVNDNVNVNVNDNVLPIGSIKENRTKKFVPPSLDEVKAYFIERGVNDPNEPQAFMDYYTSNGWKVGRNSMKDWRATIRTWIARGYNRPTGKEPRYDTSGRHVESI